MNDVTLRSPSDEEQHKLHRLGEGVQIATLSCVDGEPLAVAAGRDQRTALVGPFVDRRLSRRPMTGPTERPRVTSQAHALTRQRRNR